MTNQQLINLLESFMDGQTTVEQETQLADFFRQATDADRPEGISNDDWQAYCEMFRMFENGMEDHTATIRPVRTDASEKKHRILPLRWMTAAASVAVLLVGALTLWNHTTDQPQPIAQSQPAITPVETDTVAVDRRQIPLDSITPPAKPLSGRYVDYTAFHRLLKNIWLRLELPRRWTRPSVRLTSMKPWHRQNSCSKPCNCNRWLNSTIVRCNTSRLWMPLMPKRKNM